MIKKKEKEVETKIFPTLTDLVEYDQLGKEYSELFKKIIKISQNEN